jgi:pimeloyl-ACP methyl ester carboxylesterase
VWGTEDPIAVSAMATRLHGVRPDADLTWLPGVGHYPMLESPSVFLDALSRALM